MGLWLQLREWGERGTSQQGVLVQKCGALGNVVRDSGPEGEDTATGDVLRPISLSPTGSLDLTGPPEPQCASLSWLVPALIPAF